MKKYSGKKLAAILMLMVLVLCACPSLAELIHREGGPTGGARYFNWDGLTGRGEEYLAYSVSGQMKTGRTVTFAVVPAGSGKVESYGICRKLGKELYSSVYESSSGYMSFKFYQPGTYALYILYSDGDRRTADFRVTGRDYVSEKAKEVVAECPAGDDYERALWLHDWLATNSYYDNSLAYHGADGVLIRGYGVCQSYAGAYQLLLKYAGISADVVYTGETMNHEWNAIQLNGRWYMADVTWDTLADGLPGEGKALDYCWHAYFAVPTSVLSGDHYGFSDSWGCTSVKDNYYMREGQAAEIAEALAEPIRAELDLGNTSFAPDAKSAVEKNKIGEETLAGTYAVSGDMAAELASVLLYGTTCENGAGDNFYLMTSHQASSCDSKGNVITKDNTVQVNVIPGSGSCAADVNWRYEDGTLTVSGTGTVPDYAVGAAPWGAVLGEKIRSVEVEEGVTAVSASFRDCVNAAEVTLPASVLSVSDDAFQGCAGMKWANVICGTAGLSWAQKVGISYQASGTHRADSMAKCGVCGRAFAMNGPGILHLPASLKKLGALSFAGSGISALVIPKDCEGIPENAFLGCENVKTFFVPAALKEEVPETIRGQLTDLVVMTY